MSANIARGAKQMVVEAITYNPKLIAEALDCYKQIKGDIRDYIHGPLDVKEYKNRMMGYGKMIGSWRNFLASIQVAAEHEKLDEFLEEIPQLTK